MNVKNNYRMTHFTDTSVCHNPALISSTETTKAELPNLLSIVKVSHLCFLCETKTFFTNVNTITFTNVNIT